MNRFGNDFRHRYRSRIERRSPPSNVDGHSGKIDDASITAVAAEVVRGSHEDAIHRAWLDTQSAEHALRVIDRVVRNAETFAAGHLLLADVDAIDGTGLGALVAGDTSREIEAVKPAVAGRDRNGQFGILEVLREGLPLRIVCLHPVTQRDPKTLGHGGYRRKDIEKPATHLP